MGTWVLTDDYRCPKCFGPVELRTVEKEEDEGWADITQLHCLACDHRWEE